MKSFRLLSLLALLASVLSTSAVFADDVPLVYCDDTACYTDPATLQVGTTVPPSGTDPNLLTGTSFSVYQNQGSAGPLVTPWKLILGVPNATITDINPFGAISFVASAGGGTGFATPLNSGAPVAFMGPGQEAYSQLKVQGPTDNSNNFVNWSAADKALAGITATTFGLYEFDVNANIIGKSWVTFSTGSMPTGTIAIAYGQITSSTGTGTKAKKSVTIFDTPFTQAGLELPPPHVPEPASMMLLGAGILALGMFARKNRK